MKKLTTFILLLTMLFTFVSCGEDKTDSSETKNNAKSEISENSNSVVETAKKLIEEGKIQEAYSTLYKNRNNIEARKMLLKFRICPAKHIITDSDGNTTISNYTYDEKGNILKSQHSENEYTYDSSGNVIKQVTKNNYELIETTEYTYDANDNLIKISCNRKNGSNYIREYTYNSQNDVVKTVSTKFSDNEPRTESVDISYIYDNNGRISKMTIAENDEKWNCTYKYDEKGRISELDYTMDHDDDDTLHKYTYSESETQTIIEYTQTRYEFKNESHFGGKDHIVYDTNGNPIELISYNADGSVYEKTEYSDFLYFYSPNQKAIFNSIPYFPIFPF